MASPARAEGRGGAGGGGGGGGSDEKFCYCGDSNSLEFFKIILNRKFHAASVPKISLEFNTVRRASGKEFCSHSSILGIKLCRS